MQTPRMQEVSQESPRKNDSRVVVIPVSFDQTKPPTASDILSTQFDHYEYHVVLTTNDFSIFSIQAENENYLLYQRKLYSSASALADSQTEEIMCAADQEEEVLKTYHSKITTIFPQLMRVSKYKDTTQWLVWKTSTFYADYLFKASVEVTLTNYLNEVSSVKPVDKEAFQILTDLAGFYAKVEELGFPAPYIKDNLCLVKRFNDGTAHLQLLSAGILDRLLCKPGIDEQALVKENQSMIVQSFCRLACEDKVPSALSLYETEFIGNYNKEALPSLGTREQEMVTIIKNCNGAKTQVASKDLALFCEGATDLQRNPELSKIQKDDFASTIHYNGTASRAPKANTRSSGFANWVMTALQIAVVVAILAVLYFYVLQPYTLQSDTQKANELQDDIERNTMKINMASSSLKTVLKQIAPSANGTTGDDKVGDLTTETQKLINTLDVTLKAYASTVADNKNGLDALQNNLLEDTKQLTGAPKIITSQSGQVNALKQGIQNLINSNSQLKSEISSLSSAKDSASQQISSGKVTLSSLTQSNTQLQATQANLDSTIQNQLTSFFQSLLDLADLNKLAQSIYRVYLFDSVDDVIITKDGGYLIIGSNFENSQETLIQATLRKLDCNGTQQWERLFQLTGSDRFFEVHQTDDGGYALAGNVIPGYYVNVDDLLVWKVDANGNDMWNYSYPWAIDGAHGLTPTSDGNLVASGSICTQNLTYSRMWIVKINNTGGIMWDVPFPWLPMDWYNNVGYDVHGVIEDANKNIMCVGVYNYYSWFAKIDSTGTKLWEQNPSFSGFGVDIKQVNATEYLVLVSSASGFWVYTSYLLMIDNNGNIIWMSAISDGFYTTNLLSFDLLPDGYILGGFEFYFDDYYAYTYQNLMVKTDLNGKPLWRRSFSGGIINKVRVAPDNAIIEVESQAGISAMVKFYLK